MTVSDKVRLDDADLTLLVEFDRDPDNTGTDTLPVFTDTISPDAVGQTFNSDGSVDEDSIQGLMSAADKTKLDGIEQGAILRDWVSYLAGARNTSETTTNAMVQRTWKFNDLAGTEYFRRRTASGEDKIYSHVSYEDQYELASQYY